MIIFKGGLQMQRTTKLRKIGTSLGLTIPKAILELYNLYEDGVEVILDLREGEIAIMKKVKDDELESTEPNTIV